MISPMRSVTWWATSPAVLHDTCRKPLTVFRFATVISHARSTSKLLQRLQRQLPELLRITHTLSHDPIISYQTRGKDGTKTRSHQNQATSSLDTERISLSVRESPIRGIYLIMSPIYTLFGLPNRPRSLETLHPFAAFNIIDFNLIMGSRII